MARPLALVYLQFLEGFEFFFFSFFASLDSDGTIFLMRTYLVPLIALHFSFQAHGEKMKWDASEILHNGTLH